MAGAVDLSALKQRAASTEGGEAAGPPGGVEVTEANLEAEVLVRSSQVPVVVLLWSPRSDASVQLGNVLAQLADADGGKWSLATVNVDAVPRVAQMFGVQAIPTVVALGAGQPLSSFQGVQPPEQLRRWVDSLLDATAGKLGGGDPDAPEQVDPEVAQARSHLDAGDFDAALRAYRRSWTPTRATPRPRERSVRSVSSSEPRSNGRMQPPWPTQHPMTSTPPSRQPMSRSCSRTWLPRSTGSPRWSSGPPAMSAPRFARV